MDRKSTYINRLYLVYDLLKKSRLYTMKEINEQNLTDFANNLNKILPVNDYESGQKNIIYHMYECNRSEFRRYVYNNGIEYLLLLTPDLSRLLGLKNVVNIKLINNSYIVNNITERKHMKNRQRVVHHHEHNKHQKNHTMDITDNKVDFSKSWYDM